MIIDMHVHYVPGDVAELLRCRRTPPFIERLPDGTEQRMMPAGNRLSFSDFLDPYPDVTVRLANLGGTLPIVLERMDNVLRTRSPGDKLLSRRLGRVFLDYASLGSRAIEIAAKIYGQDRLVLGTDYPIFQVAQSLAAVEAADIDVRSKGMLLGDNAEVLVQGATSLASRSRK